ncbi:helix-turn-helix domain-containing protein [Myroides profundi]|uniref:Transcriptional regulator, AraC family n=1 Tax=Myroides profundi TaxID=480520 RepID=A0AAJ4W565_MYRPR|nr:AraC family transcriptional regulator [Myroides profundi]AJH15113.1 transcriptional regulator [Myroides profundi]SER21190.1 transcriptional regulator, AraC family [Myroides profundi]
MALFITLDNVYSLYDLDAARKIDGIVVFHQYSKANQNYKKHSRLFEGLLLGVVLKGAMKTQIHFSEYEVNEGDIAVVPPQVMIETKSLSEDAEIVTIGLSLDFISTFPILREFVMNDQIRWQPIIRLDPEELLLQQELIKLIEKVYNKKQSSNKIEMLKHLVMVLINLIIEKYQDVPNTKNQTKNRTHEIIDNFYSLVSKYAHKQRNVQFYADKLHLSTQYLSSFLKQNTGRSTLQWIDHVLILHAKTLLKSSSLSIKEISNELEFTDTSVFCRYFKRNTGMSPKLYREEE